MQAHAAGHTGRGRTAGLNSLSTAMRPYTGTSRMPCTLPGQRPWPRPAVGAVLRRTCSPASARLYSSILVLFLQGTQPSASCALQVGTVPALHCPGPDPSIRLVSWGPVKLPTTAWFTLEGLCAVTT